MYVCMYVYMYVYLLNCTYPRNPALSSESFYATRIDPPGGYVCMYVCMYVLSHIYSKSMDQTGKVASPARGQLNRKKENFPVRVRA